ncbi:unnamed protein product [Thelazia callipaeda]|uniref:Non-specific serine/threonine protein kinase n=1 Tax=Thelazia callipaeda TaxID=103827 RepID=A0A0N5CWM9_THECL|nr:unnamed protein product [Thelazia callipaeda]
MDRYANFSLDFNSNYVAQMEEAANMLMSPNVPQDVRKFAEQFFLNIRNRGMPPDYCRLIIEATSNEFVIFEMVQLMVSNLFKHWFISETTIFRRCFEYLVANATGKFRVSKLIRCEMLRACAKLFKRSIFDNKACDADLLDQTVHLLLSNEDEQLQSVACDFIEAITYEFATSWRTSNLGITFDFHQRAKLAFENGSLQRLFEKCILAFSNLVFVADLTSSYHINTCGNLLRVVDLILSWDFDAHGFPFKISSANEGSSSATFRPPQSWKPIFQSNQILRLFFELHKKVRYNADFCAYSMNCLVQLSSLMGPVLSESVSHDPQKFVHFNTASPLSAHDRYISDFVDGFIDLFGSDGPLQSEIFGLCMMVGKLLTYHRIISFRRAEKSLPIFSSIIVRCAEHLTPIAIQKVLKEDDTAYVDALKRIYDGWWVLLRNSNIIVTTLDDPIGFKDSTLRIVAAFVRSVLSEPFGSRGQLSVRKCGAEKVDDDREIFQHLLDLIGQFSSFYCANVLPYMFTVIFAKLKQFISLIEIDVGDENLSIWREDMHWTLILIDKYILTVAEDDGGSLLQNDVVAYFEELVHVGISDIDRSIEYINSCIVSPHAIIDSEQVNTFIKVVGAVLAWCSLEHNLLIERGAEAISPELARTSLWCAKRLIVAMNAHVSNPDESENLACVVSNVSQTVVDFALQKSFGVLNRLSGERKLCLDAVELLIGVVRNGCVEAASSRFLFPCLSAVQIEKLPARHSLLKMLVELGALIGDEIIYNSINEVVLKPLSQRYIVLSEDSGSLETNLADLIECFGGVAEAAHNYYSNFLYEYLTPILKCSIKLLASHKDSQLLTNAVLQLFCYITKYSGADNQDQNNMVSIYEALLALIIVYRDGFFTRYKVENIDVEEQASDLVILLDILANVMNRDVAWRKPDVNERLGEAELNKNGLHVALTALEMLLPVMEDGLLRLPILCKKFYRFIFYLAQMAPQYFENLSDVLLVSIVECLKHGLRSTFGEEISLISADAVTEIASFYARHIPRNELAITRLTTLFEPAFEFCLMSSWQSDSQNTSSAALFSLLCCDQTVFQNYVKQLLLRVENRPYQSVLQPAFQLLLPENLELQVGRRERRGFRDRLEQFLSQAQGLLVVE